MVAGNANFIIEQDATFIPTVAWKNPDGSAINITGASALLTMSYNLPGGTPGTTSISSLWGPSGYILVGGANGVFTLVIPASTTKTYTWVNGTYDMQVLDTTGTVTRLIQGGVVVNPAISQIV